MYYFLSYKYRIISTYYQLQYTNYIHTTNTLVGLINSEILSQSFSFVSFVYLTEGDRVE